MPKIVDHQKRRRHIASVTAKLIATQGLEGTSIRQIAKESSFSKGIIEHYFDSKDELISCTLDWVNESYNQRIEEAVKDLIGLAALEVRIRIVLPLSQDTIDDWKIRLCFFSLTKNGSNQHKKQSRHFSARRKEFLADIKQAKKLGELSSLVKPLKAANCILYAISGASISSLHLPKIISTNELRQLPRQLIRQLQKK
tara:strand:+ start:17 stop:610 length:594 start_codon:yes stop_codon:yes gene_type:complete